MSSRKEIKLVVDLFIKYYSSLFKLNDYRFKMTDSRATTIKNFITKIKELTKSDMLHERYMEQYFEHQFNHWYDYESKSDVGRIQIEWIIGNKALERWKKSDPIISAFVVRKNFKTDVDIKSKLEKENWNNILLNTNEIEESEKERFHNTVKGFHYCLATTTLYNHKSEFCITCKKSTECKIQLKKIFPKIHKKRGYDEIQ